VLDLRNLLKTVKRALVPSGSVASKAVSSGIWSTISNFSGRILQLAKLFVLVRFLSPEAFGIYAIALLTKGSIQWFSSLGISEALIQNTDENIDRYLDTSFCLSVVRGLLLSGIIFIGAPVVADFFSEPTAVNVIRAVALAPFLSSLGNPGVVYLAKDLDYHKNFVLTFGSEFVNVITAIGYAIVFGTVWAFVAGLLAGRVFNVITSYMIHNYRPRLQFDAALAREMISYGKWITISGPLLFLLGQGDDAFVGWLLGASALGIYRVAYRVGNAPGGEIAEIISNVTFPAFSKVQGNKKALRKGYFDSLKLVMAIVIPATFGIVVVSEPLVVAFFGQQWLPAISVIQFLALFTAILAIGKINFSLMLGIGRPDINTKIQFLQLFITAALIYPMTNTYRLVGTAGAISIAAAAARIPHTVAALHQIEGTFSDLAQVIVPPLVGSIAMTGLILGLRSILPSVSPRIELASMILIGLVLYTIIILLIERYSSYQLTSLLRQMVEEVK
jgi:PST family polysaccharide transporter/lipopolysaccharide exporter